MTQRIIKGVYSAVRTLTKSINLVIVNHRLEAAWNTPTLAWRVVGGEENHGKRNQVPSGMTGPPRSWGWIAVSVVDPPSRQRSLSPGLCHGKAITNLMGCNR
jgi:hypothetical protein